MRYSVLQHIISYGKFTCPIERMKIIRKETKHKNGSFYFLHPFFIRCNQNKSISIDYPILPSQCLSLFLEMETSFGYDFRFRSVALDEIDTSRKRQRFPVVEDWTCDGVNLLCVYQRKSGLVRPASINSSASSHCWCYCRRWYQSPLLPLVSYKYCK